MAEYNTVLDLYGSFLFDTGLYRCLHGVPQLADFRTCFSPVLDDDGYFIIGDGAGSVHSLHGTESALVSQRQLRHLSLLSQMSVDSVFFYRKVEHLGSRCTVDITTLSEDV